MTIRPARAAATAFTLCTALWYALLLLVPLHDGDLWFHLNGGRWIVEHLAVPRVDPFTLARSGAPWIDLHWGFQLLVFGAWSLAGPLGLSLLKAALGAALALGAIAAVREVLRAFALDEERIASWAPWALFPLGLALALRPVLRPELLSFVLLSWQLRALARYVRTADRKAAFVAIALQVALANVQGLFVLGWVVGAAWLLPVLLRRERRSGAVLTLAGLLLAPLLNPYGTEGWTFPFVLWSRIDGSAPVFQRIAEFTGALVRWEATAAVWWLCAAAVLAGAIVARARGVALSAALVGVAALLLAYQARRNLSFAGWAAAFAVLPVLAPLARRTPVARSTAAGFALALVACCDLLGPGLLHGWRAGARIGVGLAPEVFPERSVDQLRGGAPEGGVFCDLNVGAYVAFATRRPVLVDGRLEVLGRSGLENYLDLLADAGFFERTCEHFGLERALLDARAAHTRNLLAYARSSPRWRLRAAHGPWLLFERAAPTEVAVGERNG